MPSNIPELTSVRAFAALAVILFHMYFDASNQGGFFNTVISYGHLGVDLFFILSGLILTHVYLAAWQSGTFSFLKFIRNRIARLYPLHIAMIVLFLLAYQAPRMLGAASEFEGQNWSHLPWHFLMLHAWGFTDGHSWNFPSWSISAEFFAYLAFPVTLFVAVRIPRIALLVLSVALFFAASIFAVQVIGEEITKLMFNYGIVRVFFEFFMGVAIYLMLQRYRVPGGWVRPLILASLGLIVGLSYVQADERIVVLVLGQFLAMVAQLSIEDRWNVLRHPWLVYLGEISYSTYMVHILVLICGGFLADRLGMGGALGLDLAQLAIIYVASAVLYHVVELPGRSLIRSWRATRPTSSRS